MFREFNKFCYGHRINVFFKVKYYILNTNKNFCLIFKLSKVNIILKNKINELNLFN